MKRCSRCNEEKPNDAFYQNHRYADGLSSRCIACINEVSRQWRREHRDVKAAYQRRWRQENPEKQMVQKARELTRERQKRAEKRELEGRGSKKSAPDH